MIKPRTGVKTAYLSIKNTAQGANRFTFWQPGARIISIVRASLRLVCSSQRSLRSAKCAAWTSSLPITGFTTPSIVLFHGIWAG